MYTAHYQTVPTCIQHIIRQFLRVYSTLSDSTYVYTAHYQTVPKCIQHIIRQFLRVYSTLSDSSYVYTAHYQTVPKCIQHIIRQYLRVYSTISDSTYVYTAHYQNSWSSPSITSFRRPSLLQFTHNTVSLIRCWLLSGTHTASYLGLQTHSGLYL